MIKSFYSIKTVIGISVFVFLFFSSFAQDKVGIKFNHVAPEDFTLTNLKVDTSYGAVIIADIGNSSFEGNNKGWFTLVFKRQIRIKIINQNGFDLATVIIPLYIDLKSGNMEKVESLNARSYNLEKGAVIETRLDQSTVFTERIDKNHEVKKFALPAVKSGTIIEYSYVIKSEFLFNLKSWSFQGSYPCLWSEYVLDLPSFFEYVFLLQGNTNFQINTSKRSVGNYRLVEQFQYDQNYNSIKPNTGILSSENTLNRWVMKNVPVQKEEKFVFSPRNNISRIEFQMSGQQFPGNPRQNIMATWSSVASELLKDENFGLSLDRYNSWLNQNSKEIKYDIADNLKKAKEIYGFVRNNIQCKGTSGLQLSVPLKETYRTREGYVSEINLLLVALLKYNNITASPVILSTRSNGYPKDKYPLLERYNYVICKTEIDGVNYLLDASKVYLGFNKLPQECYNGLARIMNTNADSLDISTDSLIEKKLTIVSFFNDGERQGNFSGVVNSNPGYYNSCMIRQQFLASGKQSYEKNLEELYSPDFFIDSIKYTNENENELPISISYNVDLKRKEISNTIYLNPMLKEGYIKNIFSSEDRENPIEMPSQFDDTYVFRMEIPTGYTVDELPLSVKVTLNKDDGYFEYLIEKTGNFINLRSRIRIIKTTFLPEDYEPLRNFFGDIVKKHAEQIVFKMK